MRAANRKGRMLDPASRVTLHIFLAQLTLSSAIAAALPAPYSASLAAMLAMMALVQAGAAAHAAPGPGPGALTEWDGIAWLIAVACLALAAA